MNNPYTPTSENLTKQSHLLTWGWALVSAAVAMPVLGLIGTIFGIYRTFTELDRTDSPSVDEVSRGISYAFETTAIGAVACVVLAVSGAILIRMGKRREAAPASDTTPPTDHMPGTPT